MNADVRSETALSTESEAKGRIQRSSIRFFLRRFGPRRARFALPLRVHSRMPE